MLGHRKLNVDDYLSILKRRFWLLAIPVVVLPVVAVGITWFIPARYVSQTLVLIEEQKVPDEYVKPVISSDLDARLASMKEQILSRSSLQPIIERYNLYAAGKANSTSNMDDRIDQARKSISIKPIHSEIAHSGGLPGFFIAFTASDAHTAQLVCTDITSLFLSENLRAREASSRGTTDFLKGQLEDAKRNLDEQDRKLADFQRQYVGKLPGQTETNVNMLTSLNTQLEAANQALARMEQDKTYLESMIAQQSQGAIAPGSTSTTGSTAPQTAVATQAHEAELQALLAQEADLTLHYTADYPDVKAVQRKIADLRKKMAEPTPSASANAASPAKRESPLMQQLRAQLGAANVGIKAKQQEQAKLQSAIGTYQDRIQSSPLVEEQYKELTRDYTTAQKFYDDLLTNVNHSKMATDLERRQQGEQFKVMDEPNLPDAPTYPNRMYFGMAGLLAGLAVGGLLTAFLEYKNTALRTEQDVWTFMKLPTLAIIQYAGEVQAENDKSHKEDKTGRLERFKRLGRRKATQTVVKVSG